MKNIKLLVRCANCDADVVRNIADFTGRGVVDVDLMIEGEGFDCYECGKSTGVMLIKESF